MVSKSERACVGCSCHPSPALMTDNRLFLARISADPADECRRTRISACMNSRFLAVSSNVSPFTTLLEDGEKFTTSALKRLAASSNEVRVRVLGSKNTFTTVFPRRAGTFLISRPLTSLKGSAASRSKVISSDDSEASPRRSFRLKLMPDSPC